MLVVTADMIRDLVNYNSGLEAREVAIALGARGWDVCVTVDGTPGPVLMTAEDAYDTLGGGPEVLEEEDGDELAEALATPDPIESPRGAYRVLREDGSQAAPDSEVDYRVVTETTVMMSADDVDYLGTELQGWDEAWWFDLDKATLLISEESGAIERGSAYELWMTEGGRYVAYSRSIVAGRPSRQWSEITPDDAVQWMYRVDDDRIDRDALPPLMQAVRDATDLAERLTVPTIPPETDPDVRRAKARHREDRAVEVFENARILGELLRNTVLADLRQARAQSARVVLTAHDYDRTDAGDALGIAATNKLLQ